jgi:Tfp pilus assembly protein PilO
MKGNDRIVLLVMPLIAAVAAFWFLALAPKQNKAKELESQVSKLQSEISAQRQATRDGRLARKHFPRDYQRLVVMAKAVPVDDETASLLVQIRKIARRHRVSFRAIKLGSSGAAAPAAAPAPPAPSTSGSSDSSSTAPDSSSPTPAPTSAPATETAAASLPIGATVGSGDLATLPYQLTFRGNFFQIADLLAGIDSLVRSDKNRIISDGRLVTIDGFGLGPDGTKPFPIVKATLVVTTYVLPGGQGLTAGATPSSPPATSTTPATTASSTPSSPPATSTTPATTASSTPTAAPAPTP